MPILSIEETIDQAMKILGNRIKALPEPEPAIKAALDAVHPQVQTGSCCYMFNGANACIDDVTEVECNGLNGSWDSQHVCALREGQPGCPPIP
jgi:hypothetical protein